MSDKVIYRLELAITRIDQIFEICKPRGVTTALEDELLAKPAIMKHIDVVSEQFKKLEKAREYHIPQAKSDLRADIQKDYDKLRKNGLELDKSYADKLKGIIKSNSNENVK